MEIGRSGWSPITTAWHRSSSVTTNPFGGPRDGTTIDPMYLKSGINLADLSDHEDHR
jgi:hypothetical protein